MFSENLSGAGCRTSPQTRCFFSLLIAAVCFSALRAAENKPALDNALPLYQFPYENPLYATLVGFLGVKNVDVNNERKFELKVDSFKKKVPVHAVIQEGSAPLVVVIPGIDGRADGDLAKLWPSWYEHAGYHVLWFDSTFRPSFIDISGHGVTGNLKAESERIAEIIQAFLNRDNMQDKVTKIGIVGMSYGATQALLIGEMAHDSHLPFTLDAVQAYSPPIDFSATGKLIDRWFSEDRWNFTLAELSSQLSNHKAADPNGPSPFSDSLMRAGISAVFRMGLVDVILRNDAAYKMNVLPVTNEPDEEFVRREYAAAWGYSKFMNDLAYPYWQRKLNLHDISELTEPVELCTLLNKQPVGAGIILSQDDPFNTAEDLEKFKKCAAGNHAVTLLPRGGHLGYISTEWTKAKLLSIFSVPAKQTTSVGH